MTLKDAIARIRAHRSEFSSALLARRATEILTRWERPGRVMANHVRQMITSPGHAPGKGWKGQAIWEALVAERIVPELPREVQENRQNLRRWEPRWRSYWQQRATILEHRLKELGAHREVKEVPMLPRAVRKHFGLTRDPFHDEIRTLEDRWWGDTHTAVRDQLLEALEDGAPFIRVAGPRGAGKTQIGEEVLRRLAKNGTLVVRPPTHWLHVLNPGDLVTEIVVALATWETGRAAHEITVRASHVRRTHQMRFYLRAAAEKGKQVVLWIDEGHDLPRETQKVLKRFWEETDAQGRKVLGIVLIGQNPELTLEELTKRLATIRIPPLHEEIPGYVKHKLARAGGNPGRIITDRALRALAKRCPYPLDANAMMAELLIQAHREQEKMIDLDLVEQAEPGMAQAEEA